MQLTNAEIAGILSQHADLLEISGENRFRVGAYRRAAETVLHHERSISDEEDVTALPGIGAGIAAVLDEIVETGRYAEFEELQAILPGSLLTMVDIPGLGPKRVKRFYEELNISSVPELEEAASAGRLSSLKGIGPKAELQILEGIRFQRSKTGRVSIGVALPLAERLAQQIQELTASRVEIAGSVRRMCETVGDINLLVVAGDRDRVINAITDLPEVAAVVQQGEVYGFDLHQGVRLTVMIAAEDDAGRALIALTGSADHVNSLGGIDAIPALASEAECYAAMGMEWIAPELREDHGEIEAAREGRLPVLITVNDLLGDLHLHTTWSDGTASPFEMAAAAARRGYEYLAITDHSGGLGIANGLDAERLAAQGVEIKSLKADAPLRLLRGSEIEVHRDGRLDFSDEILSNLDLVVASLHSGITQDRQTITDRMCRTLQNPHVDIVAHPTGRLIERRQGADYDWEQVFAVAAASNTAIEINGNPARLDMDEVHARAAGKAGVLIAINSDAHNPESLEMVRYGVGIARRAWLEPGQVINTWSLESLQGWLTDRKLP